VLTLTTLSTDAFDLINKRKHCLQYHFIEKAQQLLQLNMTERVCITT